MTSGLQRGSNLPTGVPRTMVIPEERERDFERKMKSPLFSHHFEQENWALLFFDAFRQAFTKTKSKTSIESFLGKKKSPASGYAPQAVRENQGFLSFSSEDAEPATVGMVAERPPSDEQ